MSTLIPYCSYNWPFECNCNNDVAFCQNDFPTLTVVITELKKSFDLLENTWEAYSRHAYNFFYHKTQLHSVAFLQWRVCRCFSCEKNPSLQFARPRGKSQWNEWLQAFLRLFTHQLDKPKPWPEWTGCFSRHGLQHRDPADTFILRSRRVVDLCRRTSQTRS